MQRGSYRGDEPVRQAGSAGGRVPALRASVLSGFALAVAMGAHTAAGGALPSSAALALLLVGVVAVGVGASTRRWHASSLLLGLGASQVALHLALDWLSTCPAPGGAAVTPHARHHGATAAPSVPMAGTSAGMLAAHAAALALTAWLWARGERTLRALAARLWPMRPGAATTVTLTPTPAMWFTARIAPGPARRVTPARGPPREALPRVIARPTFEHVAAAA